MVDKHVRVRELDELSSCREGEREDQWRKIPNGCSGLLQAPKVLPSTIYRHLVALAHLTTLVPVWEVDAHPCVTPRKINNVATILLHVTTPS